MPDNQQPATKRVLIAEPDPVTSRRIQRGCGRLARVTACRDFLGARARLLADPPDVLVTNLRLEEYNGLHLIILSGAAEPPPRCLVHTDRVDLLLISEAQAAGALFERTERLPYAMASYLLASWPPSDRRDARRVDRRALSRGGRRASDHAQFVSAG